MPLAFLIIGTLFIVAAVRGKEKVDELFSTLKSDFTGPNNFFYWGMALFAIGALGYYKPLKPVSNAFLGLVIIVLLLSHQNGQNGFFESFMQQIGSTTNANPSNRNSPENPNNLVGNINALVSKALNGVGLGAL